MFLRPHGQATAISALLQRIGDAQKANDVVLRDQLIASAWAVGATAQEIHDASDLPGAAISDIITEQGEDPKARRRGWRPILRRR